LKLLLIFDIFIYVKRLNSSTNMGAGGVITTSSTTQNKVEIKLVDKNK
jgi:hypothetical protein